MRLATKLTLGYLLPVVLIWLVAFYAGRLGEHSLREHIERSSKMQVHALMDEIDRDVGGWIREWRSYLEKRIGNSIAPHRGCRRVGARRTPTEPS